MPDQENKRDGAVETINSPAPVTSQAEPTAESARDQQTPPPVQGDPPSGEAERKPPPPFEDPRKAIAASHRTRRMGEMQGTTEDFNDSRLVDPTITAAAIANGQQPPAPQAEPQAQPQPAAPPAKQMVKVKIDGVEQEVPLDDVVSNYQKDRTADSRLQQATELLNSAKKTVATGEAQPSATKTDHEGESGDGSPPPTKTKTDAPTDPAEPSDEELTEVVNAMFAGSTDEAVKSLKKVLKRPAPQSQPADINAQVDRAIALREENKRSADALDSFATKFTQVKTDKVAGAAMVEIIRDELLADLRKAEVPEAFIEQFKLTEPAGFHVLKESHKALRAVGREGVRKTEEILGVVAKNPTFLKIIGPDAQPAPQIDVDRGARKDGVQAQPALRNPPPPPPANQQQGTKPADRAAKQSGAVDWMRAKRGQSSTLTVQ